jgi:Cys-rich repeat protein
VCGAAICVECAQDSDCPSGKVCDESAHICGGCFSDADCTNGATCTTASHSCSPPDSVYVTGNGLTCSLGIERSGDEGLAVGMMGLLAFTARRLRRRRRPD